MRGQALRTLESPASCRGPEGLAGSVVRAVFYTGAAQVSTLFLGLLSSVLTARLLGVSGRGIYAAFVSTVVFLGLVLDPFGYKWSNTYMLGRKASYQKALRWSASYALGLLAVLLLLLPQLDRDLVRALQVIGVWGRWSALEPLLPMLALAIPASLLCSYINAILLGLERFRGYGLQTIAPSVVFLITCAGAYLAAGAASPRMVAAAWVASLFAGSVLGTIQLRRSRNQYGQSRTEYSFLQSATVGFRAYSVNVLAFLHLRIDVYLVAYYLSPHDLGLYAVAVGLAELVTQLPAVFGTVVFSKSANETGDEVGELVGKVVKLIPAIALIAIPAFWLLGRHVITILYGGEFAESYHAALWLLPGVVFLGGTNVINNFLAGKGYPWFLHVACFASLGLNVLLNLAWIPRYRIVGASLASSASYGLWFLVLLIYFRARFGRRQEATTTISLLGETTS